VEGAHTLAVESHVLGEALADHEVEALLVEVVDRPGVILQGSSRESLIRAVEPGEVVLGADDLSDLLPLRMSGVETCVCAVTQEEPQLINESRIGDEPPGYGIFLLQEMDIDCKTFKN